MPPPNLCERRKLLYQAQLDGTEAFLGDFLDDGVFTSADKRLLQLAVADGELVEALEEILIPYVVYGVALDLQRLAKSQALFCGDAQNYPSLSEALPSGGPDPEAPPEGYEVDDTVGKVDAYGRYFARYINPPDVGGGKSGVEAFYERYPLLEYAVKTSTSHYQHNIQLACERVAANWSDIGKAFFPRRKLVQLAKITTTGNDFHKGGKQVLILTFDLDVGTGRVVYKPSAVEIDCRIVGDSSVFKVVSPQGDKDDTPYTQVASLTELINEANPSAQQLDGFTTRPLPTYRILPYNRRSVPDAYGYIEYLTHEPELQVKKVPLAQREQIPAKVGREVMGFAPAVVQASDWIVDDPTEAQAFYHQFGGLMAMAMAVSLCDLHLQNVRVYDGAPCLIDLEEALKRPMTSVSQTYLAGAPSSPIGSSHDPDAPVLQVDADKSSALSVRGWASSFDAPAACVLYVYRGNATPAEPARLEAPDPDAMRNRRALLQGFVGVIDALATPSCNDKVKAWVGDLYWTIARYVARATKDYAKACRALYMACGETDISSLSRDGSPRAPDAWYDQVSTVGASGFFFRRAVSIWRDDWGGKAADPWRGPYFALEHPAHAWRDYLNCDVPAFYHRLGSADLVNSKDETVNAYEAIDWQNRNITSPSATPSAWQPKPNERRPYLPETPIDMVTDQLERLRKACWLPADQRTVTRVQAKKAFLAEAFDKTGLAGDLKLVVTQHQPVGAEARE